MPQRDFFTIPVLPGNFSLDKFSVRGYSVRHNRCEKGRDEEEYAVPLAREGGHSHGGMLEDRFGEGLRKVASEPAD